MISPTSLRFIKRLSSLKRVSALSSMGASSNSSGMTGRALKVHFPGLRPPPSTTLAGSRSSMRWPMAEAMTYWSFS